MNKSLISNLLATALVVLGLTLDGEARVYVLNTGLFALSGGITNWLAVHMLFEKVPLLYGSGVIQIRFNDFKMAIRNLIMEQFFQHADMEVHFHRVLEDSDKLREGLQSAIDDIDLEAAFESLLDVIMSSSFAGMLGMIGGRDALAKLQEPFIEKMRQFFKDQLSNGELEVRIQSVLRSALDDEAIKNRLSALIDERLDEMTPQMVKEIVQRMIHEHLGWLVVWGAVFGGSIGLAVTLVSQSQILG